MLKHELQNLLSGIGKAKHENLIQTISDYLAAGKAAGKKFENTKRSKQAEEKLITEYINQHVLSKIFIDENRFIARGAEQKVYLDKDGVNVLKLNTGIFYHNWNDYLNSLMIHNFFFPATKYTLLGFINNEDGLCAAIKQPYVVANEITNLEKVKRFMENNGFILKRYNDYYSNSLGIIAEDLHDENVLSKDGVLFFIDTVFYLTDAFYNAD